MIAFAGMSSKHLKRRFYSATVGRFEHNLGVLRRMHDARNANALANMPANSDTRLDNAGER